MRVASNLLYQHKKQQDVRFTCNRTIAGLNMTREWYYPSCTSCTNKIQINEGTIECKIHGNLPFSTYR